MAKRVKNIIIQPTPYHLLAIYTDNNDYRMAWLLNTALGIQMQRENTDTDGEKSGLSIFSDRHSLSPMHIVLIANKYKVKQLAGSYGQVDFFLKITINSNIAITELTKTIGSIDSVTACAALQTDKKLQKILDNL